MNTLNLYITKQDIQKGERQSCTRCPIANAMARVIGRPANVGYGISFVYGEPGWYILPAHVIEDMRRFDNGGDFPEQKIVLEKV